MQRRKWMAHCSLSLGLLLAPGLASATKRKILVLGDSLSAEYGLARGSGWVALLEAKLKQQQRDVAVLNASISGDTTSGGRSRLPALLKKEQPSHVIIELGGNDALRGLPLAMTRENLRAMVQDSKKAGARVLLVGMQMPANYGAAYGREFSGSFETVAREEKVGLVPFLLAGVADRPDAETWFQPDRIHPLAKAHPLMLEQVWKGLAPML